MHKLLTKAQKCVIIHLRDVRCRPTLMRECGKILTLLYEAWLCFLTLLVEGLPLKFNTGRCVCKFDTVTPEPKLVKIGHVTRKCITTCSLYVNVSLRQVTKCLNDVNGTYIPEPRGSGVFLFSECCIVTLVNGFVKPFLQFVCYSSVGYDELNAIYRIRNSDMQVLFSIKSALKNWYAENKE